MESPGKLTNKDRCLTEKKKMAIFKMANIEQMVDG